MHHIGLTSSLALAAASILNTECALGAPVQEVKPYHSTVTSIDGEPLLLWAELNYDNDPTLDPAPIAVVMHGFSPPTGNFSKVRDNAHRLRDSGFFVISVAMRGRDGSQGVRDSGGVEIHDIYDAVEHFKVTHATHADGGNVHITGYSGGGGNVMSALTKFPDYFRLGSSFFGISDYGLDTERGWFQNGANGGPNPAPDTHKGILIADIGDPRLDEPDVINRYRARASNLASRNNPYSEIHLFVNETELTNPPVNHESYLQCAESNESFPGEFNNIHHHIGDMSCIDFNNSKECEPYEIQYWEHGFLDDDSQRAAESWYIDDLRAGLIPQPTLNTQDELYVAGFVTTKPFTLWLGDGQSSAGTLRYELLPHSRVFSLGLPDNNESIPPSEVCLPNPPSSPPTVDDGLLTLDTTDMAGRIAQARVNGVITGEFLASDRYSHTLRVDETLRIHSRDTPIGHWALDEDEGDDADDSGVSMTNGVLTGLSGAPFDFAVGSVPGKVGRALAFDGVDDVIELGTIDAANPLMLGDSDFSISAWVYQPNDQGHPAQRVVEKADGPNSTNGYSLWIDQTSIGVSVHGRTALRTAKPPVYDEWYHIAATMTKDTGRLYINGQLQALILHDPRLPPSDAEAPMRIGSRTRQSTPSRAFLGRLDDLRIYDHALTAGEVREMLAPRIARWTLDETSGTVAHDSGAHQNHGALSGDAGSPFDFSSAGTTGKVGRGLSFDGIDDVIELDEIDDRNPLMLAESEFSISVWVYQDGPGAELSQRLVEKSDGPNSANGYSLWIDVLNIGVSVDGRSALKCRNPGIYGEWFHIAATMTPHSGHIYLNGAPQTLTVHAPATPPASSPAPMVIGGRADAPTKRFQGRMDGLTIFGCALDQDQVERLLSEPPIGHWTFDETHGARAGDIAGRPRHATLRGLSGDPFDFGTGGVAGKIGKALQFDGNDDVVDLGTIEPEDPLTLADSEFTISVWVSQPDNEGDPVQRIVDKSDGPSGAHGYTLWIHRNSIGVSIDGRNALKIRHPGIYDNTWYHLAATMTADRGVIYINGEPQDPILHSPELPPSGFSTGMRFGSLNQAQPASREFRGALDDLRIYHRALCVDEINAIHGMTPLRSCEIGE